MRFMLSCQVLLMQIKNSALKNSYNKVGNLTWVHDDFLKENISKSRSLFETLSLNSKSPQPKKFNVIGLLSGLPFPLNIQNMLVKVQADIKDIIGNEQIYFVEPPNLGIEYYVFKWPNDQDLTKNMLNLSKKIFNEIVARHKAFSIEVKGIQINPDGCIIAKGFPYENDFFEIRDFVKNTFNYASSQNQSNWMHIPLGRILNPVGVRKFKLLRQYITSMNDFSFYLKISSIHLIHEKRWYMTEKDYILSSEL